MRVRVVPFHAAGVHISIVFSDSIKRNFQGIDD